MAASTSRATNRRIPSHQHAAHQVERLLARPASNALAVSREAPLYDFLLSAIGDGDIYQPHWLFFRAAAGARDSGDADSDVGIAYLANVVSQGESDLLAHRAVGLQHQRWNIGEQ